MNVKMLFYKLELGTLALVKKLSKSYVIYITHFRNAIYMIKKCFSFFNEEDYIYIYIYIYKPCYRYKEYTTNCNW